jgi:IS5 family transposase
VPDDTTLIRWTNLIGQETVRQIHERVVGLAREHKLTRGRKLRIDGTVVETDVAHPTDSGLLSDGVRVVLGRLARKAKRCILTAKERVADGARELFRDRTRSAKRLARKINEASRRRTKEAKEGSLAAYRRLVEVASASLRQAERQREALSAVGSAAAAAAEALGNELSEVGELVERVIEQTRRRVFEGEQVPAQEKLVSIFEEHTRIIRRGKSGKPTEFGRKVWLSEVEGGIISDYRILAGNPKDESQVVPSLETHQRLFGRAPWLLAGDRGTYSEANEAAAATQRGVKRVSLPKPGYKSPEREEKERERWFRRAQRFRAGIEGRISVCKRRGALGRCRDKGEEGFERWVGLGIVSANLLQIARKLAADQEEAGIPTSYDGRWCEKKVAAAIHQPLLAFRTRN